MSTFLGLIEEIPGISIDRFDGDNLHSSAFFLSHCHSDHMKGLNPNFFYSLKRKNSFLYCSHISKLILESDFNQINPFLIRDHVIVLNPDESKIINYVHCGTIVSIAVTCISSGHCPGSVMFLLNFRNKQILYTGDFRISIEDIPKLKSLHYNVNSQILPLQLDKIYLDTTFLDLNFQKLPSRVESLKKLAAVTKEWLEESPRHIVILEISALYGSEYLYIELSKMLNKKIHVKDKPFRIYKRLDILVNHVTDSPETSIHACMNKPIGKNAKSKLGLQCNPDVAQNDILTVIPSVQRWIGKDMSCIVEQDSNREQTINVCYSTHASYSEIEAFIKHFKPLDVFACVEGNNTEVYNLLKDIMQIKKCNEFSGNIEKLTFSNYKIFDKSNNSNCTLISDDDDD